VLWPFFATHVSSPRTIYARRAPMSALGCGPCGSSSDVVVPGEGRQSGAGSSSRVQAPVAVDEDEFAALMGFYLQASALHSQARLAVEMLEDQIAMGVTVNDVTLRDAKAMMVETKKTLDEVGMLQAG